MDLEAGKSKQGCWHSQWCRLPSWFIDRITWWKISQTALGGLFCKDTNLTLEVSILMTWWYICIKMLWRSKLVCMHTQKLMTYFLKITILFFHDFNLLFNLFISLFDQFILFILSPPPDSNLTGTPLNTFFLRTSSQRKEASHSFTKLRHPWTTYNNGWHGMITVRAQ